MKEQEQEQKQKYVSVFSFLFCSTERDGMGRFRMSENRDEMGLDGQIWHNETKSERDRERGRVDRLKRGSVECLLLTLCWRNSLSLSLASNSLGIDKHTGRGQSHPLFIDIVPKCAYTLSLAANP